MFLFWVGGRLRGRGMWYVEFISFGFRIVPGEAACPTAEAHLNDIIVPVHSP